jgi:hypothetical protein
MNLAGRFIMYHDPHSVLSPKGRVKSVDVVFDKGPVPRSWSVAEIDWDGDKAVGIRYNGDSESSKGLPQARGNPAWFIVPPELESAVLAAAKEASRAESASLVEGYRMMAADREREAEAEEWTEGLIGDAY